MTAFAPPNRDTSCLAIRSRFGDDVLDQIRHSPPYLLLGNLLHTPTAERLQLHLVLGVVVRSSKSFAGARSHERLLQQGVKLLDGQAGLSNDGPQRTFG